MSYISYNPQLQSGGALVANTVAKIIKAKADITLAFDIIYQLTYNGVNPPLTGNLENSPEFDVGTSQGQDFYTAVDSLKTAINSIPTDSLAKLYQGSQNF